MLEIIFLVRDHCLKEVLPGFLVMKLVLISADNWIEVSPLVNKVKRHKIEFINNQAKVSDFIDITKKLQLQNRRNILWDDIVDKINHIPIPVNNIDDKIAWKFTSTGELPSKRQLGQIIIQSSS